MTGFLIELRSRGRTEQLESKVRHVTERWVSRAGDFAPANTVADAPLFRSTRLCCLGVEWVSLRRDGDVHLGTILAIPPATDAEELDVDDIDIWSALHALLEDVACRVQLLTRRNGPIVPQSPTRLNFHDILPFDEQWGYGARALGVRVLCSLAASYLFCVFSYE
ncbi:hypothetical protein B0H14DRAFT_3437635 [Mycena olivaceomarginata]|nr:hypothetical protein B0H14DRAFT_3437635 [Mycena olivaceomarginata]